MHGSYLLVALDNDRMKEEIAIQEEKLRLLEIEYDYIKKLNNKLLQQIQDSILIASSSLPSWTSWLTHSYKFLYSFEWHC